MGTGAGVKILDSVPEVSILVPQQKKLTGFASLEKIQTGKTYNEKPEGNLRKFWEEIIGS